MLPIFVTLIVEIIAFVLFIYFFAKVLWKPLMNIMEERRAKISEGLAAADRGVRELNEATEKGEVLVKDARKQANEILANAQRQANDTIDQAREEARSEGERIVTAAREEVDQAVAQARVQLQNDVGQLAVSGAERILKREIDAQAHNDIIDELVAEVR